MRNNSIHIAVSPESIARKHEARDPHLRNPLIIVASVILMILFCLANAGILMTHFCKNRAMQNMSALGVIGTPNLDPLERFPKPNLQIDDDHAERTTLLAAQNEKLNSYGWVDRSNGIVQIPIEHAIDLLAQRGLPCRTNGISPTDGSPLQFIQERPAQ